MKSIEVFYNIGDFSEQASSIDEQSPTLLLVNKSTYSDHDEPIWHNHRYLEIFCFLSGEATFCTREETVTIKRGDVLAVNAEVFHAFRLSGEDDLSFYSILIDNVNLGGLRPNSFGSQGFSLLPSPYKTEKIIHELIDELTEKKDGYHLAVKGLIYQIFTRFARHAMAKTVKEIEERPATVLVKNYIDDNFASSITLDDLVSVGLVNKFYLIHSFKKAYNLSPMQYLTMVRMNRAKILLAATDKIISDVANEVGYDNPVYFAETFKKTVGTSPTMFRKIAWDQK